MIEDFMKIVLRSLVERGVRTWLTMIGIFIGIAAVVSLVSLGQGLQNSINEQFEMMGVNAVLVTPGGPFFGIGGGAELTDDDLEVIEKVRGVQDVAGMLFKYSQIKFKDEIITTAVIGLPTGEAADVFTSMQQFQVAQGRFLESKDKKKVAVGYLLAEGDVYEKPVKLRDKIEIEGEDYTVIGSLVEIGNPADDSQVYVSIEQARILLNEPDRYDIFWVRTLPGFDTSVVADKIKKDLRKSRDLEEGDEDFTVETSEGLQETYSDVFSVVTAVVIGLAAISLFVGGLGIMNTMYTSVLERTQEIGVMKAIGARNSHILVLFLIESGTLGAVGGAVGIVVGIALSNLITYGAAAAGWTFISASFPWYLIVGSFAFSFIVGSISGALPAMQAAKLKPVEALRYE
ncbi:ABC transporter permease [Candidatus Woesearchaeota archaeon]|nr:ABC transporter permease [Candidatus Woesearchaeota archaeon]